VRPHYVPADDAQWMLHNQCSQLNATVSEAKEYVENVAG